MHDSRRHKALARIVTIRDAERSAARHELFLAAEREREALADRERANGCTNAAASAWQDHLSAGGFYPELARAHATELVACADAASAAEVHAEEMAETREASAEAWRAGDARCRQAERSFAESRRTHARDREERALEALADRVASDWSRR